MDESRAMKAVYVYSNYDLRRHKQSAGDAFAAFNSVTEEAAAAEKDPLTEQVEKHTLQLGNLIFRDVTEEGGEESEEEGAEKKAARRERKERRERRASAEMPG
eukprot:2183576-Prymnesium_polylepis.1